MCAPCAGQVQPFEDDDARAFAHDETVPVGIEGAAGACRVLVAGAQRAHVFEAGHRKRDDARLRTAGDHHVGLAAADDFRRLAERVAARGAGSRHGQVGAAGADHDADMRGGGVRHQPRHGERADPARPAVAQNVILLDQHVHPADARAHHYADAAGVVLGHVEPGIGQRLLRRGRTEVEEAVHAPRLLLIHVARGIEVLDFRRKMDLVFLVAEKRDRPCTGTASQDRGPGGGHIIADGSDQADARRDDAL